MNEFGQQKNNANRLSFQKKHKGSAPTSTSAPAPKNKVKQYGQSSRVEYSYSQGTMAQGGRNFLPTLSMVETTFVFHEGCCGCFQCGQTLYFMIESPKNKLGNGSGDNRSQSSSVTAPDKAAPRGATTKKGGGTNLLYALTNCQEHESSLDFFTGMIQVFEITVCKLLDL